MFFSSNRQPLCIFFDLVGIRKDSKIFLTRLLEDGKNNPNQKFQSLNNISSWYTRTGQGSYWWDDANYADTSLELKEVSRYARTDLRRLVSSDSVQIRFD